MPGAGLSLPSSQQDQQRPGRVCVLPVPLLPSIPPPSPHPSAVCNSCSLPLAASLSRSRSPSSLGWILTY